METIKQIEEKWFKECERLGEIVEQYKKGDKSITQHPRYLEMKKTLKLTNEAYQDIAEERDKLKETIEENWKMFKEEVNEIREKLKKFINNYGVSALTFEDIDKFFYWIIKEED